MLQAHEKLQQPRLLPGRRPIIQIVGRPFVQPPKIVTQSKIIFQAPVIQKPILSEKLVKLVKHVGPVTKPIVKCLISEILDHLQQVPGAEHVCTRPKTKIIRQDIRQEKPAYADPIYRPPPKPVEASTQYLQRKQML